MQLPLEYENNNNTWSDSLKLALSSPQDYLQPRGRDRIGFSSPLTGNGSCLTRSILEQIPFEVADNGGIFEYYFRLISAGEKVRFICGKKINTIIRDKRQLSSVNKGVLKKFTNKLIRESIKGNFTAFESLFNIFIPSVKLIFTSLVVLLFAGVMLCLAADLPGSEILLKYGIAIVLPAALSTIFLHLYIFIGMIEKRVTMKTWTAALLWPLITIAHFLLGEEKS
jgi:hypothetical protein